MMANKNSGIPLPRTTPYCSSREHRQIVRNVASSSPTRGPSSTRCNNKERIGTVHSSTQNGKSGSRNSSADQHGYTHKSGPRNSSIDASGHSRIPSPYPSVRSLNRHKSAHQRMLAGGYMMLGHPGDDPHGHMPNNALRPTMLPLAIKHSTPYAAYSQVVQVPTRPPVAQFGSPMSSSSAGSNVTASFFARAAQKLITPSRKKKRAQIPPDPEPPPFPTNFCDVIRMTPPPAPPQLLRGAGRLQAPGSGKVKVMLRICPVDTNTSSWLSLDNRKKQVTVYDPSHYSGFTAPSRRMGNAPPKMFAFDAIFSQDDTLTEICATSLIEIIQAVVQGADGCLFCYGHARLGKTYTMLGVDDSAQNLGIIPCAISWLFKLINEQKDRTGARFSVRVSAVEVTGKQEKLKDLLADVAGGTEAGNMTAPGVYLREDPICGLQIENQSELRAPTADHATYYLDAAVAARTVPEAEEDARNSHLLFTLSVYQYRVEKSTKGQDGVAGGRSRLHLLDLGSCSKRDTGGGNALSLSALGNVILALLNGQRHVPHRESKLTQLIKESLGNWSCRTCMIAHVSPAVHSYNETLQVIQLAARIHRMKRRSKNKWSSTSSDDSSDQSSVRMRRVRPGVRMGILRNDGVGGFSHSDPDYSSSEQSCDTVIYVGSNGQSLSDRELTDNEGPPSMVPLSSRPRLASMAPSEARIPEEDCSTGEKTQEEATSRLPKPSLTQKPTVSGMGYTSKLPPKSPLRTAAGNQSPGIVQLPRKVNPKLKSQMHVKPKTEDNASLGQPGTTGSEHWVDGPSAAPCPVYQEVGAATWSDSSGAAPSEPWLYSSGTAPDGQYYGKVAATEGQYYPNVQNYISQEVSSGKPGGEHWVDGPRAPSQSHAAMKDRELWVDGPTAFRVESPQPAHKAHNLWSESPRDSTGSVPCTHSLKSTPKSSRKDVLHQKSKSRTLELHKPMNPQLLGVLDQRPVGQLNAPSNSSLSVNAESEPNSCDTGKESDDGRLSQVTRTTQTQTAPPHFPVKTFVHDWVVKHSVNSSESTEGDPNASSESRRSHASKQCPPKKHSSPKHKLVTVDDMALSAKTRSPERCISSTQSSPRLRRLHKHSLPVQSHPTERTAAWVMSVTDQPTHKHSQSNDENTTSHSTGTAPIVQAFPLEHCPGSNCSDPPYDQDLPESPPPDYDSCIEDGLVDEDIECDIMDYQDQVNSQDGQTSSMDIQEDCNKANTGQITDNETADCDKYIMDTSSSKKGSMLDVNNLLMTNRESIYELQMDEQLECADGMIHKNMSGSDDLSGWSSGSYQNVSMPIKTVVTAMDCITTNALLSEDIMANVHGENESGIASDSGGPLSPHSSVEEKSPGKLIRPCSLRRPDGASNPNLTDIESEKDVTIEPQYTCTVESPPASKCMSECVRNPAADGQSPQSNSPTTPSKLPSKLPVKSSLPSPTKPCLVPKPPICRSSRSMSLPVKSLSKPPLSQQASPELSSVCSSASNSPTKSPGMPSPIKASPVRSVGKSKLPKASTPNSTSPSQDKTYFSRSSSAKSSKSTRLPTTSGTKIRTQSAPTKSSTGKESRSSSRASSKSPSPSKRDKESRLPKFNTSAVGHRSRHTDSDSGNDSGIVKNDRKLLSPYSKLTNPRISSYSASSGHGSDNSSTFNGPHSNSTNLHDKLNKIESSSGYDSMLREDSEITSNHDSTSESSAGGNSRNNNKQTKKKDKAGHRSRSAPAHSTSVSPASSCIQSPVSCRKGPVLPSSRAWVDTRRCSDVTEPLELKVYNEEDLEKMARRRREAQVLASEKRSLRLSGLLSRQEQLKIELMEAKSMLMVDKSSWSFDLHVAHHMDRDEPGYMEALEKETSILEKRVEACKSRIMLVTCFDV